MEEAARFKISGDAESVLRAQDAMIRKMNETLETMNKVSRSSRGSNQETVSGLEAVGSKLMSVAAGYASVSAAIGMAKQMAADLRQEQIAAAEGLGAVSATGRKISQVATSAADRDQMRGEARLMAARHGFPDLATAEQFRFDIRSRGQDADLDLFASMERVGMGAASALSGSAQKFQGAFGAKEAGTNREIINKIIAAAGPSDVEVPAFAQGLIPAAGQWSRAGWTDESLMGFMSVATKAFKNPEQAATAARQIGGRASEDKRFQRMFPGGTPQDYVKYYMALSDSEKKKIGGDIEFKGGMQIFATNAAQMAEVEKTIWKAQSDTGTAADIAAEKLSMVGTDPREAPVFLRRQKQALLDASREEIGVLESKREAARMELDLQWKEQGRPWPVRWMGRRIMGAGAMFGAPEAGMQLAENLDWGGRDYDARAIPRNAQKQGGVFTKDGFIETKGEDTLKAMEQLRDELKANTAALKNSRPVAVE
jgi:hypothetical protein